MINNFTAPIAIRHKGKAIYFVAQFDEAANRYRYLYNVLSPKITSANDKLDWDGYSELTFPKDVSLAGYNVLRIKKTVDTQKYFQVLSDEKYVYIIRATEQALYINRYLMIEVPNESMRGESRIEFQPAWEVRYQRSKKPDSPASEKDTQNFISVEGEPFEEPIYELPFGGNAGLAHISDGCFTVNFVPTNTPDVFRWQFFITDVATGLIYSYSFTQTENGWFNIEDSQVDKVTNTLQPDVKLSLTKSNQDLFVSGLPATVVYTKQEPFVSFNNQILKLQRSYRMLFVVQITASDAKRWVATLDFAISSDGTLALMEPQKEVVKVEVGEVNPAEYVLKFTRESWVNLSATNPIILNGSFTQQLWVFPTINDLERHTLMSGNADVADQNLPPSIWITEKRYVEVGFGNGNTLLKRKTIDNVLIPNAWNNIAVIFENGEYKIFINGAIVEHVGDDFTGQIPTQTPLAMIGDEKNSFIGNLDEVRVWSGAQYDKIVEYLYAEIPRETISDDMQGYWRFDEGYGKTVYNLTPHSDRDGSLSGPQWVAATAPIVSSSEPIVYIDKNDLTLYAGVMIPENNENIYPYFGNIKSDSRPYLLASYDGFVHLYYQAMDGQLVVIQYDTAIARAHYGIPWRSEASEPNNTQKGNMVFSARQVGTVLNNACIDFERDAKTALFRAELNDNKGGKEVWKGLTEKISYIVDVLSGQSLDDSLDPRIRSGEKVFYDYSGKRYLKFQAVGDPLLHGYLLFISRNYTNYICREVQVTIQDNPQLCSVKVISSFGENLEDGVFVKTLKNVSTHVPAFIDTVNGVHSLYNYDDPNNTNSDETKFYTIQAEKSSIMLLISDSEVTSMQMTIENAEDSAMCKVVATLTLKNQDSIISQWLNVPRKAIDFIEAIKNSSEPVAKYLHFSLTNEDAFVENCNTVPEANLLAICSFVDVFNLGAVGDVQAFNLSLDKIQGVESTKNTIRVNRGSSMFSIYTDYTPNNGYPAILDDTTRSRIQSDLLQPGQNGGWIAESPRYCVEIFKDKSLMQIPLDSIKNKSLDVAGSMTMEGWVKAAPPVESQRGLTTAYPRMIHCNSQSSENKYMMGLVYSNSLQFLRTTKVQAEDTVQPDEIKLFNQANRYTYQFYLKADLGTPLDGSGKIFERIDVNNNAIKEQLTVDKDGVLTYVVIAGTNTMQGTFDTRLLTNQWTMVTITRNVNEVAFYLNSMPSGKIANVPALAIKNSRIILGNNTQDRALEMELNQFSVWKDRTLNIKEIENLYQKPVPRDDQNLVLLWGLDEYRNDNVVINSAVSTGNIYNTSVAGKYFWDYPGMFCRVFGAIKDTAIQTRDALVSSDYWNHMALIYNVHYGIEFDGGNYADCGTSDSLNVQDGLSVEAWIKPKQLASPAKQVIISKYSKDLNLQSYEVGLTDSYMPYIKVKLAGVKDKKGNPVSESQLYFTCQGGKQLTPGTACMLNTTVNIESTTVEEDGMPVTYYTVVGKIYANGVLVGATTLDKLSGTVTLNQSSIEVNIGRTKPDDDAIEQAFFQGQISDLSIWNVALSSEMISERFSSNVRIQKTDGLISAWNFTEQQGRVAFDKHGENKAVLSDSEQWIIFHENSSYKIMVNGVTVPIVSKKAYEFGGYEQEQLMLGGMLDKNGAIKNPLLGAIDEIRIWKNDRTVEQITDNMYHYLNGNEKNLVGYWRFDAGSGNIITDQTGNGNNGQFYAFNTDDYPRWITSTAPINNEAAEVLNALGGLKTDYLAQISAGPTAVEYSDVQLDSEGEMFSVLKRCYIYQSLQDNKIKQVTGYKIGDLALVYLGQVQTRPSIIGYIEGTPPLPSENLTKPYYTDPLKPSYLAYYNNSSVKLTSTKSGTVSFASSRDDGGYIDFDFKIGFAYSSQWEAGQFLLKKISAIDAKALVTTGIKWSQSEKAGSKISSSITKSNNNFMYNCGDWEYPDSTGKYYLNTGERRFIPNNEGYALVKSSTADIYSQYLQSTGTLVGTTIVPNLDIPADINLIYFPLNPKYIKNGTLDGKLGLQNDPDYPDADLRRGSYFQPVEAYNIKKRIEKKERELMASYAQFDAAKRGKAQNKDLSQVIKNNYLYDWENNAPKKDMVNTYVWTAAGGLYSEKSGYVSMIQENQSGSYDFSWSLGFSGDLKIIFGGPGLYTEASLMGGTKWTVSVEKDKEENSALELEVNADPDGFLNKYLGKDAPNGVYYSQDAVPGKVDSYRFMTFYLSPDTNHFNEFFQKVIDQTWLNTSSDPRAAALREARNNENPCWRIMHRVTYVSRIPSKYQSFPVESQAVKIEAPVNVEKNSFLISLINNKLNSQPTPAEIGDAVRTVIMSDLKTTIPWWQDFLSAAEVNNSEENTALYTLIQDTIQYMNQYYYSAKV